VEPAAAVSEAAAGRRSVFGGKVPETRESSVGFRINRARRLALSTVEFLRDAGLVNGSRESTVALLDARGIELPVHG
jgi:hypothetical protein